MSSKVHLRYPRQDIKQREAVYLLRKLSWVGLEVDLSCRTCEQLGVLADCSTIHR